MSRRIEIGEYVSVSFDNGRIGQNGFIESIGAGIIAIRSDLGVKNSFDLKRVVIERLQAGLQTTNLNRRKY